MPYLKREAPCPEPLDCRILTAALDLFVERGYHNVSVHHIQKQSDVSIGSIYKHFGGKEGIAKALYEHILNELDELIDDVLNTHDSPTEQCKEIIKQLFEHTETHQHIIAYLFHTKHTHFLPNAPLMCDTAPFIKIRDIIQTGIQRGEFKDMNIWVATAGIFGAPVRMIQLRLDGLIEKPLIEYYDEIVNATWGGFKK